MTPTQSTNRDRRDECIVIINQLYQEMRKYICPGYITNSTLPIDEGPEVKSFENFFVTAMNAYANDEEPNYN